MSMSIGANNNSVAFGAKVPTKAVLEVVTGRCLGKGIDGVYQVCDTMTGRSNMTHHLPEVGRQCREVLVKKFPILGQVVKDAGKFFDGSKKNLEDINTWVAKQVKTIGSKELDVPTFKVDDAKLLESVKKMFGG